MSLKTYRYLNSDIFVVDGKLKDLRLLQGNVKDRLSNFYLKDTQLNAKINCSFFTNQYVLGRNQGDLYQETHSDSEVYNDFAVVDNTNYKVGQLHSWDVISSVCGYSPVAITILDGKDVELISTAFAKSTILRTRNPLSALAILEDNTILFICVDGRTNKSKGLTMLELRDFIKANYPKVKTLCNNDGGGSAELIYEGRIINNPSDGKERIMWNCLALIKDNSTPSPSELDTELDECINLIDQCRTKLNEIKKKY